MVSSKIDLTENGDFGAHDILSRLSLNTDLYDFMLPFNLKHRHGKYLYIFCEKEHEYQKPEIFCKNGNNSYEDTDFCHCCGMLIRIPWKKNDSLCKKCSDRLERNYSRSYTSFPWKTIFTEQQDAKDVFLLR